MSSNIKTSKAADKLAGEIGRAWNQAHRGVVVRGDQLVVFGNDGIGTDERARRERDGVRRRLEGLGYADVVEGSHDAYTWVLVADLPARLRLPDGVAALALALEQEVITDSLWASWAAACGENHVPGRDEYQRKIAADVLAASCPACGRG